MTDERYVLREINKERSKMAQGSRHKVNGCKSKKCTLPHENLTKKELEKMNGKCITIDLNHFYTWDEFLEFSDDSKVDYIENLISKYNVSLTAISSVVFGNDVILGRYITEHMLPIKAKAIRGYAAKREKDELKYDVSNQRAVKVLDSVQENKITQVTSAQITMNGFDDSIIDFLKEKFKGINISVTILVNEVFTFPCENPGYKGE